LSITSDEDFSRIKYWQRGDEQHNQENPAHDLYLRPEQREDAPKQSNRDNTKRDRTDLKSYNVREIRQTAQGILEENRKDNIRKTDPSDVLESQMRQKI
jgi:hypothetical protein